MVLTQQSARADDTAAPASPRRSHHRRSDRPLENAARRPQEKIDESIGASDSSPFGPKVTAIIEELRADPSSRNGSALRFIDGFIAQKRKCLAGKCGHRDPDRDRCLARGKSRSASNGSERPRAAAVS